MVLATGQLSIIDYSDALTLTGFITSNHAKTQIYNPDNDSFNPDWTTSNLVLTVSLFKLGTSSDVIDSNQVQSVKWYDGSDPDTALTTGGAYTVSGKTLTVSQNILSSRSAIDFIVEVIFRDTATGLDLLYKTGITFNKVENGGGITSAVAGMPNGNIFKNGNVSSLVGEVDLWRGGSIDTTNVSYQWYKQDPTVATDQGGGTGWRKLTSSSNDGETGYTTRKITIPAGAIDNIEVYKILVKDTDTSSSTYNQTFADTITFLDQSDPIQVSVTSTGGTVFKNGIGSTDLTAKLFQAGEEIDVAGSSYTYKWYKYDKDSNLVTGFGGTTDYKTGKTLAVGSNDVDTKATFICEIE